MALLTATFLINDNTGGERFVVNLPSDYPYSPGERLIERQLTQEDYTLFIEDKQQTLKIYRYAESHYDKTKVPKGLDYKTGLNVRLQQSPTFNERGLLTEMRFYANATMRSDGQLAYDDLILKVVFDYSIDPETRYAYHRVKRVIWFKENGEAHSDEKVMEKFYRPLEMDNEIVKRRTNFVSLIKIEVAQFLAWLFRMQYPDANTRPSSNDASKEMLKALNTPIVNYINGGDKSFADIIENANDSIFSVTMPDHGVSLKEYLVTKIRTHG